jgi:hypothetical protein
MRKTIKDVEWAYKRNLFMDTTKDGKIKNTRYNVYQFLTHGFYGESGFFYDAEKNDMYFDNNIVDRHFITEARLNCEETLGITVSYERMLRTMQACAMQMQIQPYDFEVDGEEFQEFIRNNQKYKNMFMYANELYVYDHELNLCDYADLEYEFKQQNYDAWERLFDNHIWKCAAKNHRIARAECYRYAKNNKIRL